MIPAGSSYYIRREKAGLGPFVRFVVVPLSVCAALFVAAGIYSFIGANRIMRESPARLGNFPGNILPAYTNAYFVSLDGLTNLNGWYFTAKGRPVSTVVMVHGYGSNRLQYGTDTVRLYDFFLDEGFNVLSFDLRHSGESSGNVAAFGYSEWQDVLGAVSYVRKVSSTTDVILYGFGSGVSASLLAVENLPAKGEPKDGYAYNIQVLGYDRGYVRGMILDCPLVSPDDYIRAVCREKVFLGNLVGQYTIPYAVRLSAGNEKQYNLAAILTRIRIPVHILYGNYDDPEFRERSSALTVERQRIFPSQTTAYYSGADREVPALSSGIFSDPGYIDSIREYLDRFILN